MWCKLTTNVDLTIKNEYQIQLQFDTHLGLHFHFLYSKTELPNKGRPFLYSPNAKDPQKRVIYHRVVEMLEEGKAISKIAKEVNITRQTVYRIKRDN